MESQMRAFPGDWTLDQLQLNIQFEEAGGLELYDCVIAIDKQNKPINICKFNVLEVGNRPKSIIMVISGSSRPANADGMMLFSDTVVVNDRFTTVEFYRLE